MIHLAAQGLLTAPTTTATKEDVLEAIRRMQLLQIDTINVVARSPYLVLFSRLGQYDPAWLDELLAEGRVFEQWAHAACFLPIEDFPLIRSTVLAGLHGSYFSGWIENNLDAVNSVRNALQKNGTVRSADFKSEKSPGGWWNWKIEKVAMEYLFSRGEIMVARRENFQRIYDLTERVMPDWQDTSTPPLSEVYPALIRTSIRALGIARPAWVADYYRLPKKEVAAYLPQLVSAGEIFEVNVEGWPEPALTVEENTALIEAACHNELQPDHTTLLSPFDPVVWDRVRARQLFGFDFMIQAYTPAAKRQYGYFPLPLLHNGEIIGRVDAKAHRKDKIFEIKGFYPEENFQLTTDVAHSIAEAIVRCAAWHQTPQVILNESIPVEVRDTLNQYL